MSSSRPVASSTRATDGTAEPSRPWGWADGAALLAIAAAWMAYLYFATNGEPAVVYDSFRDAAAAENIAAGNWLGDPALPGLRAWYPPGSPLLFGALAAASGRPALELLAGAAWWLNGLTPILLYLLVRSGWDRPTGLLAVLMLIPGSLWWLRDGAAPLPAMHASLLVLAAVLAWRRALRGCAWAAAACALLLAAAAWTQPVVALIAALGFIGHALLVRPGGDEPLAPAGTRAGPSAIRTAALVVGLSGVLSLPVLLWLFPGSRVNDGPYLFFPADALFDPQFALHGHAPFVALFGVAGLLRVARGDRSEAWVLTGFGACLAVQSLAIGCHELGLMHIGLLAHTAQRLGQMYFAIAAAVGIAALAAHSDRRASDPGRLWLPYRRAVVFLALFAVGPAMMELSIAREGFLHPWRMADGDDALVSWLRRETRIDDVVLCDPPDWNFEVLSAMTGRKTIWTPASHMNPAADPETRRRALDEMLNAADESEFVRLADAWKVTHVVISRRAESPLAALLRRRDHDPRLRPVCSSADGMALVVRVEPPFP